MSARSPIGIRSPSALTRGTRAAILALSLLLANAPGLAAQKSGVQRSGDVLAVAIPAVAFSATVGLHDFAGTKQFLVSCLTSAAATTSLKLVISRERPDGSDDNSFPSGHSSSAFQGASFIHFRYGWEKALPAYAGAAFVGFSRVYADKHYVSDVVAGAALGTLSSFLFTDRFTGVDVTPVAEGGRYGVEIRVGLGPEARRGAGDLRPFSRRSLNPSEGTKR